MPAPNPVEKGGICPIGADVFVDGECNYDEENRTPAGLPELTCIPSSPNFFVSVADTESNVKMSWVERIERSFGPDADVVWFQGEKTGWIERLF